MAAAVDLTFDPPGPGTWIRDPAHLPYPVTQLFADLVPLGIERGTRSGGLRYGSLQSHFTFGFVHGFGYASSVPAPPEELGDRRHTAETIFADRPWRTALARWDAEVKPAAIQAHLALQDVDLDSLDDGALAGHVRDCMAHYDRMVEQHHLFNNDATLPLTDFLVHATQLTGLEPKDVLAALEGASLASRGGDELEAAAAALREGRDAEDLVARWRQVAGCRIVTGFDFDAPTAAEVPGLLDRTLRAAVDRPPAANVEQLAARIATLRDAVPADHRPTFDALLDEARLTWRLRDERGVYSDAWAAGLLRRAVLAAGRRLVDRGHLEEPEHLLEAGATELIAILNGAGEGGAVDSAVDGAVLAARVAQRRENRDLTAPPILGDPPTRSSPPEGWPERLVAAGKMSSMLTFPPPAEAHSVGDAVRGVGAQPGTVRGTARVVHEGLDLARVEPGDILVMGATSEAISVVVPLLAGMVTDHGGLFSHAAIVARELGVPAVVGCGDATTVIRDGDQIHVDGDTGEVRIVERA